MFKLLVEQEEGGYFIKYSNKQTKVNGKTYNFENMADMIMIIIKKHKRILNYEFLRFEGDFE